VTALPQTLLGELTALHQTRSWFLGGREGTEKKRKGKAYKGGEKRRGREVNLVAQLQLANG